MKRRFSDNFKTLLIAAALILLTRQIPSFPWWSYAIPVLVLGIILSIAGWKVAGFPIGFLAGFIIWAGGNLYFDLRLDGIVLHKIAILFSIPKIVLIIASGLIGGLMTGLALYAGTIVLTNGRTPSTLDTTY